LAAQPHSDPAPATNRCVLQFLLSKCRRLEEPPQGFEPSPPRGYMWLVGLHVKRGRHATRVEAQLPRHGLGRLVPRHQRLLLPMTRARSKRSAALEPTKNQGSVCGFASGFLALLSALLYFEFKWLHERCPPRSTQSPAKANVPPREGASSGGRCLKQPGAKWLTAAGTRTW
jgi:hypothetical protein